MALNKTVRNSAQGNPETGAGSLGKNGTLKTRRWSDELQSRGPDDAYLSGDLSVDNGDRPAHPDIDRIQARTWK